MAALRQINEKCPSCKRGRFQPIFVTVPNGMNTKQVIERLACNKCGRNYESANRGKTIHEILCERAEAHTNSQRKSKACPGCRGTRFDTFTFVPSQVGRLRLVNTDMFEKTMRRTVTRCLDCCAIIWVEPSRLDIELKKHKGRSMSDLAREIVGITPRSAAN